MRIIGIDPGTVRMGYGIIEHDAGSLKAVTFGVITSPAKKSIESKLYSLHAGLKKVFNQYKPEQVALEEPFVSDNVRSALSIGRAQAIAMLAAGERNLPIFRYSPAQVKFQVTNYGRSQKEQVNELVKLLLGLRNRDIPEDAADALAVAICHINQVHIESIIRRG
jgi:crossover junction endodeoxyribonuclease RuvC